MPKKSGDVITSKIEELKVVELHLFSVYNRHASTQNKLDILNKLIVVINKIEVLNELKL